MDRSEIVDDKHQVKSEEPSLTLPMVGAEHSDNVGRGTCPRDHCYPMKLTSGCDTSAGKSVKSVSFELEDDLITTSQKSFLTQPIDRKEDRWVVDGQWLIREHHVARGTMFTPGCSKTCPIDMSDITSERRTEIYYKNSMKDSEGYDQVIEDDWKDGQSSHRDLERSWTGRTYFLIHDHYQEYWQIKRDLESWLPMYHCDRFPEHFDQNKIRDLYHEYRAMPEEFYTKTGKRPVTPSNVDRWLQEVQAKHENLSWHFVELYSGSGRLSLAMATAGLNVGFPIDLRYGWNLNDEDHQKKLLRVFRVMKPGVIFASPRCKFHSTASNTMNPEKKALGR